MRTIGIAAVIGQWVHVRTVKQIIWLTRILQPNRNNCIDLYARILHADSVVMAWLISNWLLYSTYLHLYVGLARTVYIHRIYMVLANPDCTPYRFAALYAILLICLKAEVLAALLRLHGIQLAPMSSPRKACFCSSPLFEKRVPVQVLSSKSVFLFKSSPWKACFCSSPLPKKRVPVQCVALLQETL